MINLPNGFAIKKINETLPMPLTLWYKKNDPAVLVMLHTRF